jgi:CRP-like cAMP-binding protein
MSPPKTANQLLKSLTEAEYQRLAFYLEPVTLSRGEVLYHPDQPITHVYFPNCGTVSLLSTFEDGGSVEVGMVGKEGMFGVSVFLGHISTPLEAIVQMAGDAMRMRAEVLQEEFRKCGPFHNLLLRYTQAFITQIAQSAACNRAHPTEGRLVRWLLMCDDRAQSGELHLTHEFIARMLGIRRASVTEAAGQLQVRGLIKCKRGRINILDRSSLEAASCECYTVMKKEFIRLIGGNGHER